MKTSKIGIALLGAIGASVVTFAIGFLSTLVFARDFYADTRAMIGAIFLYGCLPYIAAYALVSMAPKSVRQTWKVVVSFLLGAFVATVKSLTDKVAPGVRRDGDNVIVHHDVADVSPIFSIEWILTTLLVGTFSIIASYAMTELAEKLVDRSE